MNDSYAEMLVEHSREAEAIASRGRSHWYSVLWRHWKQRKICSHASVASFDGVSLPDVRSESGALAECWGQVFAPAEQATEADVSDLLSWLCSFLGNISPSLLRILYSLLKGVERHPWPRWENLSLIPSSKA